MGSCTAFFGTGVFTQTKVFFSPLNQEAAATAAVAAADGGGVHASLLRTCFDFLAVLTTPFHSLAFIKKVEFTWLPPVD